MLPNWLVVLSSGILTRVCDEVVVPRFLSCLSGQEDDESGEPQTGPSPGMEGKVDRLPVGYKYEEVLPQGDYVGHSESSRFGS